MKTIHDLKTEQQERPTVLFKECGVFFAFSTEQFHANKTPLQEGEKYVSAGAGGYMPKGKVQTYLDGIAALNKWFKAAIKETKGMRKAHILDELCNHEAFYTNSISDTLAALGQGYTAKEVWAVFNEERAKQNAA